MTKEYRLGAGKSWHAIEELETMISIMEEEVELRRRYPAIQAAWESYQMLIDMARLNEMESKDQ